MKKSFLSLVSAAFFMSILCISNVHAAGATIEQLQDWTGGPTNGKFIITKKDTNIYEAELTKDLTQPSDTSKGYDLSVSNGQTLTLDLKGHKFLSFSGIAIEIENGGTLIIKDSSDEKSGVIELSDDSKRNSVSTIVNKGTLTIDGGKIIAGAEGAAAVVNEGTLTVNGGEIATGIDNAWGLTNYKTTIINGGTFTQGYNYSVIQNSGEMTINDGTFTPSEGGTHYSLITNNKGESDSENITLNINNGNFESDLILFNGDDSNVIITGGTFKNPENVVKYLAEGLHFDENGDIVEDEIITTPSNTTDNDNTNVPQTGDNILSSIVIGISGLICLCGLGIFCAKKRYQ